MRGRPTKLNWTPCYNQYTCTIDGKRHRLGQDKEKAERQFKFLMRQSERGAKPDPSITFHEVCDYFLEHVKEHHNPDRYRICSERLQEFKDHLGEGSRVKDLRQSHVNAWLKAKGKLTKGTERLYKSIILACLNWCARPKDRKGGELIVENPLKGQLHLPEGESRGKEVMWTKELIDQVLSVASPAFCDLVKILMWTGARPSTIIRIEARHYNKLQSRWDCEDLYEGRLTKKKYVRFVRLLNDEARELVERLNEKYPTGPIFRNSFGKPWDGDAPQIYLHNLRTKFQHSKKLKWPDRLHVYALRHFFASNFLRQHPNDVEYLRVLLNHKDYKMIMKHYARLVDMDRAAFKRLEGFDPRS